MRITCPYCGARDISEFVYHGDATLARTERDEEMFAYVYERDNPAGPHREHWYHAQGCRGWLTVTRNTLTHDILGVEEA